MCSSGDCPRCHMEDQEREGLDILHENSLNSPSTSGTASSLLERRPTHGSNVSLNGASNGGAYGSNVPSNGALNGCPLSSNVPSNGALNGGTRGARGSNVPLNGALNVGARGSNVPLTGALNGSARGSNVSLNGTLNGGTHASLFSTEDIGSQDELSLESALRNCSFTDLNRALRSSPSPACRHDRLSLNGNGYIRGLEEPEMFETCHQIPNAVTPTSMVESSSYRMQTPNDYIWSLQNQENELHKLLNNLRTRTCPLMPTSDPSGTLEGSQDPNWNYAAADPHFQNFYLDYAAVNSNYNYNNQYPTDLMNNNHYGCCDQGLCCEVEGSGIDHGRNAAYSHIAANFCSNGLTKVVRGIGRADEGVCSSSSRASCLPRRRRYNLSGGNSRHYLNPNQEKNSVESMWFPALSNPGHDQDFNSAESFQLPPVNWTYSLRPQQEHNSVDEVAGSIYYSAKKDRGCHSLQKKLTEGTAEDVKTVFDGLINHFIELSTHPLGNCLLQTLLEVCSTNQRELIVYQLTRDPVKLVRISCDMHGTQVVQKVIKGMKDSNEILSAVSALMPHAATLMKDENGLRVVEHCLKYLPPECTQFLIDVAVAHLADLAMDRKGCCALQACIGSSTGSQKETLIKAIASSALTLSDDTYGNYVVQFVLEHGTPPSTTLILNRLGGHHVTLSTKKYASNVVEKCLLFTGPDDRGAIIHELIRSPHFPLVAGDQFGNYVVQTALAVSEGPLRAALVRAIRPHAAALRTIPYGKRVLSAAGLKNK